MTSNAFDLDAARRLADVTDAVAIPHGLALQIARRLLAACDEIERLKVVREPRARFMIEWTPTAEGSGRWLAGASWARGTRWTDDPTKARRFRTRDEAAVLAGMWGQHGPAIVVPAPAAKKGTV